MDIESSCYINDSLDVCIFSATVISMSFIIALQVKQKKSKEEVNISEN